MTVGSHERRDCLAASRAVACHFACDFAARSPFQTATERAAAHGTIRSTPTSVSTSTASSPRSPLGSACTTVKAGLGPLGAYDGRSTATANTRLPVDATSPAAEVPAAVGQHDLLALAQASYGDGVVRLVTGHLDDRADRPPRPGTATRWTGSDTAQPALKASRSRPNIDLCGRLDLALGRLLATDRRELAQQLLLARVEAGRGVDGDVDDQVATTAAQARAPRSRGSPARCRTGCRRATSSS